MKIHDWLQLHPLLRVALALIVGLVSGNAIGHVLPVWGWIVVSLWALALTTVCMKWKTVQGMAVLCTVVCFGIMRMSMDKMRWDVAVSTKMELSEAVLLTAPKVSGKVVWCDMFILGGPLSDRKVRASILRDTVNNRWQQLKAGTGIVFRSSFQPVKHDDSGVHLGYRRWMYRQGYAAQTFIFHRNWSYKQVDLSGMPRMERVRLKARKVRDRLLQRYAATGLSGQDYAVVAAMTLGDKSFLSHATKEVFSISGASHVLALSGLHLSIVFGLLVVVFGGGRKRRIMSLALVLLTVWAYVFLTGMSSSVMRSAIMLSVYSVVWVVNRSKMSLNALAFAAIVMMLLSPMSLWDVGFQLSFMAVLAILLLYRPLYRLLPRRVLARSVVCNKVWEMVAVSVAAQIGTAPLVAYYFGRFSCYFLLTNMVAIPMTLLILYMSCLLFALSAVPVLQSGVGVGLAWVVRLLNDFLSVVASWPGAAIEGIVMTHWQVVSVYVVMACVGGVVYYLRKAYTPLPDY